MYQGMPNQYNGYYQQNTYGNQYQRQTVPESYGASPGVSYLKGRPVLSVEEARASQIDLDGSLHVFTDIGNKKIYTKQLNLDGTATLKTYVLVEDKPLTSMDTEYVTKAEFQQALAQIQNAFAATQQKEEKRPTVLDF
jgi:hypothetical protein